MAETTGYHVVKSCYGLWLPGDDRGHWSESWDGQIGFIEPHALHQGDPIRKRMAEERMKYPAVRLSEAMIRAVVAALDQCAINSRGELSFAAIAVEPTHMHLLIPYSGRDIDKTVKWLADQTTKAVHCFTNYAGPVWGKGKWRAYVFEQGHWRSAMKYIERHNIRHGRAAKPYSFIL